MSTETRVLLHVSKVRPITLHQIDQMPLPSSSDDADGRLFARMTAHDGDGNDAYLGAHVWAATVDHLRQVELVRRLDSLSWEGTGDAVLLITNELEEPTIHRLSFYHKPHFEWMHH